MYIRQECLFSFEDIMSMQAKNRLELIFENLDLTQISRELKSNSDRGRSGYNPTPIVRALLAQQIEQIPNRKTMIKRLNDDPVFRYVCGFDIIGNLPSEATFSRYYNKLSESTLLENLYLQLLNKAIEMNLIDTEIVSIDSSALESYERAKPRKQVDINNPNTPDWGSKNDSHGNKLKWYGWKVNMACDSKSELPLAFNITPANQADSENALSLVEEIHQFLKENNQTLPKYWAMDSGYDVNEIYEKIHFNYKVQAIIPINKRNAKQPPEGFYDFNGTPECSAGYKMIYWGHHNGYNKFRCPHILGKVNCPHGSAWCSDSNYGRVVKTRVKDNPRFVSTPHRGSENWQKIYNKRTSIERCFSRLKENLNLENIKVIGAKKMRTHVLLSCIALITSKIAIEKINSQTSKAA